MYIEINGQIIWKKVDSFFDANDSLDLKDMQKSGWKILSQILQTKKGSIISCSIYLMATCLNVLCRGEMNEQVN